MGYFVLTHCSHDLSLQPELVLKPSSKVADATFAVTRNIRDFPDMIEHVPAREEEYGD